MKETMKIMGLTSTHHWLGWFLKCFLMLLIPFMFMVGFLTVSSGMWKAMETTILLFLLF
jgi:hypothetical protein